MVWPHVYYHHMTCRDDEIHTSPLVSKYVRMFTNQKYSKLQCYLGRAGYLHVYLNLVVEVKCIKVYEGPLIGF